MADAIWNDRYILQAPPPASTMFTTELEYDGDKISGYAGSAFKAGTDLEFGYDSADNISAINNSAISTTPSQKLYLQSPLTTGTSGTSAYIGILSADLAKMMGVDETVLWEGNGPSVSNKTQDFVLNESYENFSKLQIWWGNQPGTNNRGTVITNYPVDNTTNAWQGINACSDSVNHLALKMCFLSAVSNTELTAYTYRQAAINTATTANFTLGTPKQYYECYPLKIIGIGRKN